jgi:H+/Cl- antiporter ClcA
MHHAQPPGPQPDPDRDETRDDPRDDPQTDFLRNFQDELSNGRQWLERAVVLAHAVVAGLAVVGFTLLSEGAFSLFQSLYAVMPWAVLFWMPLLTGAIVWLTQRWVPSAAGSGIPQVMAALDPMLPPGAASRFVSVRLAVGKIVLGAAGLLAGLSMGREGPSVQVAAGVMQNAQRWLRPGMGIDRQALLVAGGAAGIAAAFNAPLAGVVFAIEELSRKLESRSSGLVLAAIVLAGLMGVSVFGNQSYFGVIHVPRQGWDMLLPGLLVTVACGLLGGLFARLMIASLTGAPSRFNRWRARWPVRFAMALGLVLAVIGLVTGGATFGAGSETVRQMLAGETQAVEAPFYVTLKFIATWLSAWTGAPGGVFAPARSIGAGVGHNVAQFPLDGVAGLAPALIAIGMAAFLAAVTQAPLTAFIIVMEMVDGHAMVLSLMAAAMLASLISRLISRSLYGALAEFMVNAVLGPARQRS